jgi:hypothetical protein
VVRRKDEGGLRFNLYSDDFGVRWTESWADGARFTASPLATGGGGGVSERVRDDFWRVASVRLLLEKVWSSSRRACLPGARRNVTSSALSSTAYRGRDGGWSGKKRRPVWFCTVVHGRKQQEMAVGCVTWCVSG